MSAQEILQAFESLGIHLNFDWLTGIEVVQEGTLTNDIVYHALTVSDLRKSCILPHDHPLRTITRTGFTRLPEGSFLFQASGVVDISIPDAQRPRMSASTKRLLRLSLHIDDISFFAVEDVPISALSDVPDAGLKMIVSGCPDVVDGVVFLEPNNIQVVGGDVPELLIAQKLDIENRIRSRDPLEGSLTIPLREIQNRQYSD